MAAMTMPYQVKDAGILDKIAPGDRIKAEIVMGSDGVYLENICSHKKPSSPTMKCESRSCTVNVSWTVQSLCP